MGTWRSLRRRILTPKNSAVRLDVRGFHKKSDEARDILETVGLSFLDGYGVAAEAREPVDVEAHLESLPVRFRGFAYEGAAMGFAVRDALPFGRSDNVTRFLAGRGTTHVYMLYIGVGWAMARVPRFTWPKIAVRDTLLRWLVLDGFGFHQAYFQTRRYVREQYREPSFPWPDPATRHYADRAIDQGLGRAMWFVEGTDPVRVADLIDSFPHDRRADMYSGAGLAATYAGGAEAADLRGFLDRADEFRCEIAQGSAFAASARVTANLVVPHNEIATRVFCGMNVAEAARVCDDTRPEPIDIDGVPAYELWRQRVAATFEPAGRR